MTVKRRRKAITPKVKLEVFGKDNFTCRLCGRSPITNPGLSLEVDHLKPFSCGGQDEESNYQTLCSECNKGKGKNENLNITIKHELSAILNYINPEILGALKQQSKVSVVANQEDYSKVVQKNAHGDYYIIQSSTNTLNGFESGKRLGIYTLHDNHGPKVHFHISHVRKAENKD